MQWHIIRQGLFLEWLTIRLNAKVRFGNLKQAPYQSYRTLDQKSSAISDRIKAPGRSFNAWPFNQPSCVCGIKNVSLMKNSVSIEWSEMINYLFFCITQWKQRQSKCQLPMSVGLTVERPSHILHIVIQTIPRWFHPGWCEVCMLKWTNYLKEREA
jgi:hypothetical protein